MRAGTRAAIGGAALVALGVAAWVLPARRALLGLVAWTEALGPAAGVAFSAAYVVATVLVLPVSVLTLAAGAVFGLWGGLLVVWPGATVGAVLAFLLGRTVLRAAAERALAGHPTLASLDAAIEDDGLLLVFLLRLSPLVPFNVLNVGLGATRLPVGTYALATAVGILPGTLLYVYLGSTVRSLAALADGDAPSSPASTWAFWLGLAATIAATVVATRLARRAIRARVGDADAAGEL